MSRCLMMGPGLLTSVSAPGPIAIGPQYCVYAVHLSLPALFLRVTFFFYRYPNWRTRPLQAKLILENNKLADKVGLKQQLLIFPFLAWPQYEKFVIYDENV